MGKILLFPTHERRLTVQKERLKKCTTYWDFEDRRSEYYFQARKTLFTFDWQDLPKKD